MKRLFVLFVLLSVSLTAQEEIKKFDIRFGVGRSLLGSGDMITTTFENELNFRIKEYFSTGLSVNYGRSNNGAFKTASYIQGNLNLFFSPFKNTGKNDLRVGAGLSFYNVSDARLRSARYGMNGELVNADYVFDVRNSFGYSIIIEDTYTIENKYLIGLKLFTQPYFNGDVNSGILIKLGLKI